MHKDVRDCLNWIISAKLTHKHYHQCLAWFSVSSIMQNWWWAICKDYQRVALAYRASSPLALAPHSITIRSGVPTRNPAQDLTLVSGVREDALC